MSTFDCRACGACCAAEGDSPIYVGLTKADLLRFTPRFRDTRVGRGHLLTKLDPAGRCVCVALRGTVGRQTFCTIHERRPDECRRFEAGTAECLRARRQADIAT